MLLSQLWIIKHHPEGKFLKIKSEQTQNTLEQNAKQNEIDEQMTKCKASSLIQQKPSEKKQQWDKRRIAFKIKSDANITCVTSLNDGTHNAVLKSDGRLKNVLKILRLNDQ